MNRTPEDAIVVGVDGSTPGDAALMWAVDEAERRDKPLHLVHARDDDGFWIRSGAYPPDDVAGRPDTVLGSRMLLAQERSPKLKVSCESAAITAAGALIERSGTAHLLVVGSRGHGSLRGALLGSVSRQVSAHAACPVIVVPDETYRWREDVGVVVGVDGSAASALAAEFAFEWAADQGLPLIGVTAWWGDDPADETRRERVLADTLAPLQEKYPDVAVQRRVARAHPVDALVAASAGGQLIVVGSRGAGGFRGLVLGSVSHRILQRSHCPVAVIRPPQED